jgi:hypothetical protein
VKSQSFTRKLCQRAHFVGNSGARIIMGTDEAPLIRLSHEQDAQMKSQGRLVVPTRDTRQTPAHPAKSSKPQAQFLRPIRGKSSRASQRHWQTAATTFMTGLQRFMKAYAILRQKLYARFSEHTFGRGNRFLVSRVATHLDVRDRVSMETGRLSPIPNCPIQRKPNLWAGQRHEDASTSYVTKSQRSLPCH